MTKVNLFSLRAKLRFYYLHFEKIFATSESVIGAYSCTPLRVKSPKKDSKIFLLLSIFTKILSGGNHNRSDLLSSFNLAEAGFNNGSRPIISTWFSPSRRWRSLFCVFIKRHSLPARRGAAVDIQIY